ncbi:MAG: hypothetical protein RIQ93_1281 [Verrucomicrobiota bacterium]|jgi:hypothetical protein
MSSNLTSQNSQDGEKPQSKAGTRNLSSAERSQRSLKLQQESPEIWAAFRSLEADEEKMRKGEEALKREMALLIAEQAAKESSRQKLEQELGRKTWQIAPAQPLPPPEPLPPAEPGSLAANIRKELGLE